MRFRETVISPEAGGDITTHADMPAEVADFVADVFGELSSTRYRYLLSAGNSERDGLGLDDFAGFLAVESSELLVTLQSSEKALQEYFSGCVFAVHRRQGNLSLFGAWWTL